MVEKMPKKIDMNLKRQLEKKEEGLIKVLIMMSFLMLQQNKEGKVHI